MFNILKNLFKEKEVVKKSFNIGGKFVSEKEFNKWNRLKIKEVIGTVITDCDNDIILGDDGYFDSMRKVLKKYNGEKVKITIEVID